MSRETQNGIINCRSRYGVDETVATLKSLLQSRGATLFALIDHSGEAEKAGMTMPRTQLLIFGSPKAGTLVMLAKASVAIDLPMKILVREDGDGTVWMSYNSPAYLKERHGLPDNVLPSLTVVEALVASVAHQ